MQIESAILYLILVKAVIAKQLLAFCFSLPDTPLHNPKPDVNPRRFKSDRVRIS